MRTMPASTTIDSQEVLDSRLLAGELLTSFAESVKSLCDSGEKSPREASILGDLLFDAWEQWQALETGERGRLQVLSQLVDRIVRKAKNQTVGARGQALNEALEALNSRLA